jgi:hypothetical protein
MLLHFKFQEELEWHRATVHHAFAPRARPRQDTAFAAFRIRKGEQGRTGHQVLQSNGFKAQTSKERSSIAASRHKDERLVFVKRYLLEFLQEIKCLEEF